MKLENSSEDGFEVAWETLFGLNKTRDSNLQDGVTEFINTYTRNGERNGSGSRMSSWSGTNPWVSILSPYPTFQDPLLAPQRKRNTHISKRSQIGKAVWFRS